MKILCRLANGASLSVNFIISLFNSLFNKGKFVRRSIVLFAMYEIHYSIEQSLSRLDGGNLVTALLGIIGMLATVLAFYTVERNRDK